MRCIAITGDKKRCKREALVDKYCIDHWNKRMRVKNESKKASLM